MAGAMKKVGVYLGLLEDTDDYDDDDAMMTDDGAASQPHGSTRPDRSTTVASLAEHRRPTQGSTQVSSQGSNSQASSPMVTELSRITTLHPRTYNEARTIGEHFREGIPVIMNLSEMDDNDAKRLVDFSAGLVFAARGTIERVTSKVFLLSPPNVSVAAEDKQLIAEGGFFNQS